jgi:K+-sensing histidine kinase KdpD
VTDKPREQGQGLGLFIVRELLKFENCSITLGPERNSYGRRFKFYIDLGGVANGNR